MGARPRLRIRSDGPVGNDVRVFLDDVEVSSFCRGLRLQMAAGQLHTVTLECFVEGVDIDASVLARLRELTPGDDA